MRNFKGQFTKKSKPWNRGKKMSDKYCLKMKKTNACKGKRGHAWKGGKTILNGRLFIYAPKHLYCSKSGYVRNAYLIAEKKIGRFILPLEVIHHINENKLDDRVENLFLFSSKSKHCKYHGNQYQRKNPLWIKQRPILISNL